MSGQTFLWEVGFGQFLLVTVLLSGGAAFMTGRALAQTWQTNLQLAFYIVLLAGATRFIHFALFGGSLLTLHYYLVDLVVLLAIAFLGKRLKRARQMTTQYNFHYARDGLLRWRARAQGES